MKKFFALLMALVMVFSLSTVAFADEAILDSRDGKTPGTTPDGSSDWQSAGQVKVTVNDAAATDVYYVVINWGSMNFTYTMTSATWEPTTHSYTSTTGSWDKTSAAVTVANHSNADVWVDVAYTDGTAVAGVDVEFTGEVTGQKLAAAVAGTRFDEAASLSGSVTVDGTPTAVVTETLVGTINITINNTATAG